jgi:hypothetical protein
MPHQKPMKWVLPQIVHPNDFVCYQVRVPKERAYIGAFLGAMFLLSKPYAWGDDAAHTALEVGKVWREIFDNLKQGCEDDCPDVFFVEDDMPVFRQEGCLLQTQCADGSWVTIYDPTACIPAGVTQPPPGGTVPPGACLEYDVTLQANSKWSLPVPVDNGDVITISNTKGLWYDGAVDPWKCPDGNNGPLGVCVGGSAGFDGADPVPAQFHMRLVGITSVQGYDAYNATIAIAGYGAADQLIFQANDSTLSDDAGSISFHVKYCKASAGPVGISYGVGTGPGSVAIGDSFTVSSAHTGVVQAFDLTFSRCVRMTVTGYTGFVEIGSAGANDWVYWDCSSTPHNGPLSNSGAVPTDFPANSDTTRVTFEGDNSFPFSLVIRVDEL